MSKASSKVMHSAEHAWTPYPLGKIEPVPVAPIESFVTRQIARMPQQYADYPALKTARLVPRSDEGSGGMRW